MFGAEMINQIDVLPADLERIYQEHLSITQKHDRHSRPNAKYLLEKWSNDLSVFLDLPANEVGRLLSQLHAAYSHHDMSACLSIINQFEIFPGYPFIVSGDYAEHMAYVRRYLGMIVEKDLPKIPFFAFQKTASSYVSVVLCHLFDVSPTIMSFDHLTGVRPWVNAFARWGGVTHDHYYPSAANLSLLREAGITKCILHHRHPVDILVSFAFHLIDRHSDVAKEWLIDKDRRLELVRGLLDREMEALLCYHGAWRRLWREEETSGRMEVLNTQYEDMKADGNAFFKRMLDFYGVDYSAQHLANILIKLKPKKNNKGFNYRKASSNEWREVLTARQVEKVKLIVGQEFPDTYF